MKILHVFHGSDLHNGVDRTTLTLATALRELGVEIAAIVPETGPVTTALDELHIAWRAMPVHCCTGPTWRAELRYLRESSERAKFLDDLLTQERFDIVHLNTGHLLDAALAAARAGVPAIWHIHAPFEIDYPRYERLLSLKGYAWILETLGSAVIGVSNDVAASLSVYLPKERVHAVYNGIDSDDLRRRAEQDAIGIRAELGLPPSAQLVLGVGRVSAQKDFATFVRVAERVLAQNSSMFFLIAGPPENQQLNAELESRIEDLDLRGRVFLLGKRQDIPRLMQQSDVCLSTAIFEGQGLTTLEAMALGCPVVAMACVGLRECVEEGRDGLLTPPGDIEATATAVLKVLTDQTLAAALRQAGRETVERRFSSRAYAERFLAIAHNSMEIGPSYIAPGALELISGLLNQVGQAGRTIEQLDRPRGWSERIGRKLDSWTDRAKRTARLS